MTTPETQTRFSRRRRFLAGRSRYVWVFLAAIALAGSFLLDAPVVLWVKEHQTPEMLAFMKRVSWWGEWFSHTFVGLAGLGIAHALGRRDWRAIFLAMLLAMLIGSSINRVIKITAGRSRPTVELDAGWGGPRWTSKYHSFPSGHSASSTAFFAALFFARRRIGVFLLAIPLLIAFSRLYVGAHYFSDVVFGAMVGAVSAFYTWRYIRRKQRERPGN